MEFIPSVIQKLANRHSSNPFQFLAGEESAAETDAAHRPPGARLPTERTEVGLRAGAAPARLHRSRQQHIRIATAERR